MEKIRSSYHCLTSQKFTNSCLYKALGFLGLYYTAKGTYELLSWAKKTFLTCPLNLKSTYGDDWVVITGASDGIGLAFAKEFASRNMKLCLIGRNEDKLCKVKDDLVAQYQNCQVKYFVYDFDRKYTQEDINELKQKLSELNGEIGILFNNVGICQRDFLSNFQYKDIHSMLNVNLIAMTMVTRIVVESMSKRKRSLIIGSGSVAACTRLGQRSLYSSTKAYMECFMECLGKEYPNIDCTYLNIGPVESNMNHFAMPFKVSSEEFAYQSMKRIGRYENTTGHLKHDMYLYSFGNPLLRLIYLDRITNLRPSQPSPVTIEQNLESFLNNETKEQAHPQAES